MGNFINVIVRERVEGAPGLVEEVEFNIHINTDQITLFNKGEDKEVTFVRLVCGVTLCVLVPYNKFVKKLQDIGAKFEIPIMMGRKKRKK